MNVIVIGAGASGLMAAINAAEQGAKVTLLEHENKPGKKILVTGNGKCNITNENMDVDKFYGDKKFVKDVLDDFGYAQTIDFFEKIGIKTKNKKGYIYPASEQATTVLDFMKSYGESLGVKIKTNNNINKIEYIDNKFIVDIGIELEFDRMIIATGGVAAPKTGSRGDGYNYAKRFGHTVSKIRPALTALITEKCSLNKAGGVRTNGKIWFSNKNGYFESEGELQITEYGISGIPVFNISRMALENTDIHIDLKPDMTDEEIWLFFKNMIKSNENYSISLCLNGILNAKLSNAILEEVNIKGSSSLGSLNDSHINNIVAVIKDYVVRVKKARDFEFAQVTAGGINTDEINSHTMESKKQPGLYFAGEIIDVDVICGGYNLQFAWATGAIAGRNCIK